MESNENEKDRVINDSVGTDLRGGRFGSIILSGNKFTLRFSRTIQDISYFYLSIFFFFFLLLFLKRSRMVASTPASAGVYM